MSYLFSHVCFNPFFRVNFTRRFNSVSVPLYASVTVTSHFCSAFLLCPFVSLYSCATRISQYTRDCVLHLMHRDF